MIKDLILRAPETPDTQFGDVANLKFPDIESLGIKLGLDDKTKLETRKREFSSAMKTYSSKTSGRRRKKRAGVC